MTKRSRTIAAGIVLGFSFLYSISVLYAQQTVGEYDAQWIKRNPSARRDILNRGIAHYAKASAYLKNGDLKNAERCARDAVTVLPEFSESFYLLASIYAEKGNEEKALAYKEKGHTKGGQFTVFEEYAYLEENIDRLMRGYQPSMTLNRIVFYVLFLAGYAVIILLIMTSGVVTSVAMGVRHAMRKKKEKGEESSGIVVGEFFGDQKEEHLPWWFPVVVYVIPFVLSYGVCRLLHVDSGKDTFIFTFFPAVLIDVIIYKVIFSSEDFEPPSRFGGMQ